MQSGIPIEAMPVVEVLRRDVPRPSVLPAITNMRFGKTDHCVGLRFGDTQYGTGKCPMGLHPKSDCHIPYNDSLFAGGECDEIAVQAFMKWWDVQKDAKTAVDLVWPRLLSELLIEARDRIEDKARWCTGASAVDKDGFRHCRLIEGIQWCASGTLNLTYDIYKMSYNDRLPLFLTLDRIARRDYKCDTIVQVNDLVGHGAVMKVFDVAILWAQTTEALIKAKALIADPKRWTQSFYARDKDGNHCSWCDEKATCWCATGARNRVISQKLVDFPLRMRVVAFMDAAAVKLGGVNSVFFSSAVALNDLTDHATVMKMFDLAIEESRNVLPESKETARGKI